MPKDVIQSEKIKLLLYKAGIKNEKDFDNLEHGAEIKGKDFLSLCQEAIGEDTICKEVHELREAAKRAIFKPQRKQKRETGSKQQLARIAGIDMRKWGRRRSAESRINNKKPHNIQKADLQNNLSLEQRILQILTAWGYTTQEIFIEKMTPGNFTGILIQQNNKPSLQLIEALVIAFPDLQKCKSNPCSQEALTSIAARIWNNTFLPSA